MLRLGIDPEKPYRATFICQGGLCCCNMALISFRLFRKNLGNLRNFFGQMVYRPPWQKISRTPMIMYVWNLPTSPVLFLSRFSSNVKTILAAEAGISTTSTPCSFSSAMLLALKSLLRLILLLRYLWTLNCSSFKQWKGYTVCGRERMSKLLGFVYSKGHQKSCEIWRSEGELYVNSFFLGLMYCYCVWSRKSVSCWQLCYNVSWCWTASNQNTTLKPFFIKLHAPSTTTSLSTITTCTHTCYFHPYWEPC